MAKQWAWVAVLVGGLVLFEVVRRVLVTTGNPNLVPSLILLGAVIAPATFVTLVAGRRLAFGVSSLLVVGVAFVGGVVGVATAGMLEYDTVRDLGALPMVGVGLIEEAAKLLVPLAVLIGLRERRPADGLLLGVACGAGFAALETMGYAFVVLIRSHGDVAVVDDILLIRGVSSPAAHMAWTGLTAAALWYAANRRFSGVAVARFFGVFVLAVILHAAWDGVGAVALYVVLAVVSLALLTVVAYRLPADPLHARQHTSRAIR
ncbi:MAG: PrsW family intramembrane metalloprotease [Actinomycetota bacterium]|nr:PrsW family intramembrane metalloprotease [Actinomycetota bacterium]